MTTEEVATLYKDDPRVFGSEIFNEDLENISEEKFNELVNNIELIDQYQVIIGGVTIGSAAALWPFVMAYLRKKINYDGCGYTWNNKLYFICLRYSILSLIRKNTSWI